MFTYTYTRPTATKMNPNDRYAVYRIKNKGFYEVLEDVGLDEACKYARKKSKKKSWVCDVTRTLDSETGDEPFDTVCVYVEGERFIADHNELALEVL